MIISGSLLPPSETASSPSASPPQLTTGKILLGRIAQVDPNGQGVIRFPNGSGFAFAGGTTLRVGEQVSLEVTRLAPEITLRLIASESGTAANLAQSVEQSLMRAPDLLNKLMDLAGLNSRGSGRVGTWPATLVAGKENLSSLLQKSLPNISSQALVKGDFASLVRLLETGNRQEIQEAVRTIRQAAATLQLANPVIGQDESAELSGARNALQRVGDLLALQHVLPQVATTQPDGSALLGYRLFWLTEGGLGESIWRKEQQNNRQGSNDEESVTSVLLSLNMTQLGMVQARLAYKTNMLQIGIAAREEASLTTLRTHIRELRQKLVAANLPLHSLDLIKMSEGEMKTERLRNLGIGSGFATEA